MMNRKPPAARTMQSVFLDPNSPAPAVTASRQPPRQPDRRPSPVRLSTLFSVAIYEPRIHHITWQPVLSSPSPKLQPDNRKQHVLQHMQHNRHTRRQQLGPDRQIQLSLSDHAHAIDPLYQSGHHEAGHQLTRPGDGGSIKSQFEGIPVLADHVIVEREVGIHVLICTEVQHHHGAEKGEHRGVLREEADEDVSDTCLLVASVGLGVQARDGE